MASSQHRPLALTMGDACGIGPEIIAAWFRCGRRGQRVRRRRRRGDAPRCRLSPAACCRWRGSTRPDDAAALPSGCIPVLQAGGLAPDLDRGAARSRRRARRRGGGALHRGRRSRLVAGRARPRRMVTAPIHKEAFAAAGIGYPGHTEMLQALAAGPGAAPPAVRMMLANDELRTVRLRSTPRCVGRSRRSPSTRSSRRSASRPPRRAGSRRASRGSPSRV